MAVRGAGSLGRAGVMEAGSIVFAAETKAGKIVEEIRSESEIREMSESAPWIVFKIVIVLISGRRPGSNY
jgi:hypothetical protein